MDRPAAEAPADLPYRIALHRVHRLGAVRFGLLDRAFPSMEEVWRAPAGALVAAGLDQRTAQEVARRPTPAANSNALRRPG